MTSVKMEENGKFGQDNPKRLDTVLQALAIMRDEEEFNRKYGEISSNLERNRESSIAVLVGLIERMKRQLDAKNKAANMLKDITVWWRQMLDGKEALQTKISQLEQDKIDMQKENERLTSQLNDSRITRRLISESSSESSVISLPMENESVRENDNVLQRPDGTKPPQNKNDRFDNNDSLQFNSTTTSIYSLNKGNNSNGSFEFGRTASRFNFNIESQVEKKDGSNGAANGTNYGIRTDGFSQMSHADFSHPLLAANPYDGMQLDSSYYNPTQYFQRMSTTPGVRRRGRGRGAGGGSGGGRKKKSEAAATAEAGSTPGPNVAVKKRYKQTMIDFPSRKSKKQRTLEQLEKEGEAEEQELLREQETELDHGGVTIEGNENNSSSIQDENASYFFTTEDLHVQDQQLKQTTPEEDPEQNYFDYNSAFLDETNN